MATRAKSLLVLGNCNGVLTDVTAVLTPIVSLEMAAHRRQIDIVEEQAEAAVLSSAM